MIKFDELFSDLKIVSSRLIHLKWIEPFIIKDVDNNRTYQMNNKVMGELCSLLNLNKTLVKKLYEFDQELWGQAVSIAMSNVETNPLKTCDFICYDGNKLIDIYEDEEAGDEMTIFRDTFVSGMKGFDFNTIINSSNKIISLCSSPDYDSVLLFTINFSGSSYTVHQGKLANNRLNLFSKPLAECYNIIDFLSSILSIHDQLEECDEIVEYMTFNSNPVYLSVREILDYTKAIGCKDIFDFDDKGAVCDIQYSNPKTVSIKTEIVKSMNSMPYKSLNKLKYLKKSLRDTSVTAQDMLEFITDNLLNTYFSVDGYIIAQLCNMLDLGDFDNLTKASEIKVG